MLIRLAYWLGIGSLLGLLFGCGGIGVYQPEATETAFQATMQAMQGTIAALEARQSVGEQATSASSPAVIVVTATSTSPATNTTTPTHTSTPTITPTQPRTPTASSQGETIIVIASPTPLPPATPRPSPTPTPPPVSNTDALSQTPLIVEPEAGTVVEEGRNILLVWSWEGNLAEKQHFDIKIRPDGKTASAYVTWTETDSFDWQANLQPGRYYWSVQVIQGYYEGGRKEPENRVFEEFLGPESEAYLIIVGEKPDESPSPASTSQADPAHPTLPLGVILGGIAFAFFARRSHD